MVSSIKRGKTFNTVKLIQPADIIQPAAAACRISRDAQQRDHHVNHCGSDDGDDQDPEEFAVAEFIFFRGMSDVFKADKCPGRDKDNPQNLGEGALVRQERRGKRHVCSAMAGQRGEKANRNPDQQQKNQDHHHMRGCPFTPDTQQGHKENRRQRQQHFPQIDLISENSIQITETERIPDEITGKKRQAGCVGPEHGQIDKAHKPEYQKSPVVAEHILGDRIKPACVRIPGSREKIIPGNQKHKPHSDQEPDQASGRTRRRKEIAARNHQRTPSYAGADRQRPGRPFRQIRGQGSGNGGAGMLLVCHGCHSNLPASVSYHDSAILRKQNRVQGNTGPAHGAGSKITPAIFRNIACTVF